MTGRPVITCLHLHRAVDRVDSRLVPGVTTSIHTHATATLVGAS